MKTIKTISKLGNSSKDSGAVMSKKVTIKYSAPDEEEIREKATEIYYQRIERGEQGTPENDWYEAEKYLRETVA